MRKIGSRVAGKSSIIREVKGLNFIKQTCLNTIFRTLIIVGAGALRSSTTGSAPSHPGLWTSHYPVCPCVPCRPPSAHVSASVCMERQSDTIQSHWKMSTTEKLTVQPLRHYTLQFPSCRFASGAANFQLRVLGLEAIGNSCFNV